MSITEGDISANFRFNNRTGLLVPETITDERQVVAALPEFSGDYGFTLNETPQTDIAGITQVMRVSDSQIFTHTNLATVGLTEYFFDYSNDMPTLFFNAANNGEEFSIQYFGVGGAVNGKNIDGLVNLYMVSTINSLAVLKAGDTMTGELIVPNGSAATPSLQVGSDAKGLYHVATDKLGVTIAGVNIGEFNSGGLQMSTPTLYLRDEKTAGTTGGTSAIGYQTRDLNTVVKNTIAGASLSSNQFTLPAGEYLISASAPGIGVNFHKIKIRNITDSTDIAFGSNSFSYTAANPWQTESMLESYPITLSGTKTLELQHYCSIVAANGLGIGSVAAGGVDVYSHVIVVKIG